MEALAFTIGLDPVLTRGQELVEQYRTFLKNKRDAPRLYEEYGIFETEVQTTINQLREETAELSDRSHAVIGKDVAKLTAYLTAAHTVVQSLNKRMNRRLVLQFFRANSVATDLDELEKKLDDAKNLLQVINRHSDILCAVDESKKESVQQASNNFKISFPYTTSSPRAVLDFGNGEEGVAATAEGRVRLLMLRKNSSLPCIVSLYGIGGVGKSTIVEALCSDEKIRSRFVDGIHVVKLGKDASIATLLEGIYCVLRASGAKEIEQSLRVRDDINEVLSTLAKWFHGKRCAFLIDDAWEHGIGLTLVSRLCELGRPGDGNGVLITTREHDIASIAPNGMSIRLSPREARGSIARKILFLHADCAEPDGLAMNLVEADERVLDVCDGLPVSLAAAGKNVKKLRMDMSCSPVEVWNRYLSQLLTCRERLLLQNVAGYGNLFATLAAAIAFLDEKPREETLGFRSVFSFAEMHRRLCVLQKQAAVPASMLRHLWKVVTNEQAESIAATFVERGLGNRETVRSEGDLLFKLTLHDSIHSFAVSEARHREEWKCAHECLLRGYSSSQPGLGCDSSGATRWWSQELSADDYIHKNLCRHLVHAGWKEKLVRLLLTPQWAERQLRVNGMLFVDADFCTGIRAVREEIESPGDPQRNESEEALQLIREALRLSSGFVNNNKRELWFQLHGRLHGLRMRNRLVGEYVETIEKEAPTPRLLSLNRILDEAGGPNTRIINVGWLVKCMVLLQDGAHVVCGLEDGFIAVVDFWRSEVEKKWEAHHSSIKSIASTRDGTRVVSGSEDKSAKVWEVKSGRCVATFKRHEEGVQCVAVTHDGKWAVSGDCGGTFQVWETDTAQPMSGPIESHHGGVWCATFLGDVKRVVTGGDDGTLRIWNTATCAQEGASFEGHLRAVRSVAIFPDMKRLVSSSDDGSLRVWNVQNRQQIRAAEFFRHRIRCVAVSADETRVICGSRNGEMIIWNLNSENQIYNRLFTKAGYVTGVAFLSDGVSIVSCSLDGSVRVWDISRGEETLSDQRNGDVLSVCFTPDSRFVVSGSWDNAVRIWEPETGKSVGAPLQGHTSWITGVAMTPDGRYIVSVSRDGAIRKWDLPERRLLHTFAGHGYDDGISCVAITPNGDHAVTGSRHGNVLMWDLESLSSNPVVLGRHTKRITRVFVSDDGLRIISMDSDDEIFVWSVETMEFIRKVDTELPHSHLSLGTRKQILQLSGEPVPSVHTSGSIRVNEWRQFVLGEGTDASVLGTLDDNIRNWELSRDGKNICAGRYSGQIAFLKLQLSDENDRHCVT